MSAAPEDIYDIAIIGGGINGAGIARDAAGRGARVILFEQGDLAQGTSSRSTKLIHGGLRYLEHYAFRLVREALEEREVLWAIAPHIVRPLRFVLPHHPGLRPRWMLRAGLFLYDNLGGRKLLPASRGFALARDEAGGALKERYTFAFEYSDCWVDDARLVVLNAMDAAARGAEILVGERVKTAAREDGAWRVHTDKRTISARALVNAAGPWVEHVLDGALGMKSPAPIRLVRGSHIIVKRLFAHERAYILQNADGRIVFAIPYEDEFTLIGTTDEDFEGEPSDPQISAGETQYLCNVVSEYFRAPIAPGDVISSYSGIRSLYDDGASAAKDATRDYVLALDEAGPPLLSVYGGKITTYRRLAEAAVHKLAPTISVLSKPSWTGAAALPGGDFTRGQAGALVTQLRALYPFVAERHARRLVRAYGRIAFDILQGVKTTADLGLLFGADLYAREADHLVSREWARSAHDILWRRSKLGLRFAAEETAALEAYLRTRV